MARLVSFLAFMVVGACFATPLAAADPMTAPPLRVAVIPGVAINLDTPRVDALSQDLAEALSAELEVEAIGGLEVRRRLPPQGISDECAVTPSCAAELATRLGVTQLLFIVLVNSGASGSIQVDTTWVEPSTGHRVTRPAIDLATVGNARERFAASAAKLLPDARMRPKPINGTVVQLGGGGGHRWTRSAMVTGGATVVALGVAAGFGWTARSRYQGCDRDPCTDRRKDSIRTVALVADVGLAVAVAGAITTAILYGTSSSEAPSVMVTPTSNGAAVRGSVSF